MARKSELIRQWEILRTIEGSQTGASIERLARALDEHPRTIRDDLEALVAAGVPLQDDTITARWTLAEKPFRHLTASEPGRPSGAGFSVTELCALYFSRSILEALAGTPFAAELERAFDRLESALPDGMKRYLDRLPSPARVKRAPGARRDDRRTRRLIARLLDASLRQRRLSMRYRSLAGGRIENYVVDPYRLLHASGGIYLSAFVETHGQVRTFALERIVAARTRADAFTPRVEPGEPFPHALGGRSGAAERIEIEFDARIAPYIRAREWHATQRLRVEVDGSLRLTLHLCPDHRLHSWILSFGPLARVVFPATLAERILEELEETRARYAPRMAFEVPMVIFDELDAQPALPFAGRR